MRGLVREDDSGLAVTYRTARHDFRLVDEKGLPNLASTIRVMAREMLRRVESNGCDHSCELARNLHSAYFVVIPFFRTIDFKLPERLIPLMQPGKARPGGCLFATVMPWDFGPCGDQPSIEARLGQASLKARLLLDWMALAEAHSSVDHAQRDIAYQDDLLRKIAHAVWNPILPVRGQLPTLQSELAALIRNSTTLAEDDRGRLMKGLEDLSANFASAYAAASCIRHFVKLSPLRTPEERSNHIENELKRDYVRLADTLVEVANGELFAGRSRPEIMIPPDARDCRVEGATEAWWLVLYLLLRNAAQATPDAGVAVALSCSTSRKRLQMEIRNPKPSGFLPEHLDWMNKVLRGCTTEPPKGMRKHGMGVGLITAGEILEAWGLSSRRFSLTEDQIVFRVADVPFRFN